VEGEEVFALWRCVFGGDFAQEGKWGDGVAGFEVCEAVGGEPSGKDGEDCEVVGEGAAAGLGGFGGEELCFFYDVGVADVVVSGVCRALEAEAELREGVGLAGEASGNGFVVEGREVFKIIGGCFRGVACGEEGAQPCRQAGGGEVVEGEGRRSEEAFE
jgi:hypothetical protein